MIAPTQLNQKGPQTLEIVWSDGVISSLHARQLRLACPCAGCIDEWTREKKIKEEAIPAEIKPKSIQSVGRYALQIAFDDGHNTGIYTFELLRSLADNKNRKA